MISTIRSCSASRSVVDCLRSVPSYIDRGYARPGTTTDTVAVHGRLAGGGAHSESSSSMASRLCEVREVAEVYVSFSDDSILGNRTPEMLLERNNHNIMQMNRSAKGMTDKMHNM